MDIKKVVLITVISQIFFAVNLIACPDVDVSAPNKPPKLVVDYNLNDSNCGDIKILHIGDSNVDARLDYTGQGGWPQRLNNKLPGITHINAGVDGITTWRVLRRLKQGLIPNNKPDICIIGPLGINDSIIGPGNPYLTEREIRRIGKYLKRNFGCYVAVSSLLPVLLPSHRQFQANLNNLIFNVTSRSFPVVKFNINFAQYQDELHPNSSGYNKMAKQAKKFIVRKLYNRMKAKRVDSDGDGLSDKYEERQSGTDPFLADTDGDGTLDGQ